MASLTIAGDTSGSITLSAPSVAGSNVLSLPANTGTLITTASSAVVTQTMLASNVAGNGPTFSAYYTGTGQSLSSGAQTKIAINTVEFDTASAFNTSTYVFTPQVAGYYLLVGEVQLTSGSITTSIDFFKNGNFAKRGTLGTTQAPFGSAIIYLNGSTDNVAMYCYVALSATTSSTSTATTYFQASLIRSA